MRRLRKAAGTCEDGACPAVYVDELDTDTVFVQGPQVHERDTLTEVGPSRDEALVAIPSEVLLAAVEAIGGKP